MEGSKMKEKVRLGLIGTSWWSDLMFLPSLKSHPQADLVAVCGRDQTRCGRDGRKIYSA